MEAEREACSVTSLVKSSVEVEVRMEVWDGSRARVGVGEDRAQSMRYSDSGSGRRTAPPVATNEMDMSEDVEPEDGEMRQGVVLTVSSLSELMRSSAGGEEEEGEEQARRASMVRLPEIVSSEFVVDFARPTVPASRFESKRRRVLAP